MMLVSGGRRILPITLIAGLTAWSVTEVGLIGPHRAFASLIPPSKTASVKVRVRLVEAVPSIRVRGTDLSFAETRANAQAQAKAHHADAISEWELRCQAGRIRAISLHSGKALDLQEPARVESPAGFLSVGGHPYRETLLVYSHGSFCELVNVLDIEKYLDGLVNSEFSARWNPQAIDAQIVAARTYAYHQILKAREDPESRFDLDSNTRDQVYDGSRKEDFRASRGVERTRGLILTAGGGSPKPLKAYYHSTCGGVTELPENVWGAKTPGFKRAVRCPYCASSPALHWSLQITEGELGQRLSRGLSEAGQSAQELQVIRKGRLLRLQTSGADRQGRVREVVSVWKQGDRIREFRISANQFRAWMGAFSFRSAWFQISSQFNAQGQVVLRLDGRGNGHGVGMCQWGAKVMGEQGHSMQAILAHYYPDAVLRRLW